MNQQLLSEMTKDEIISALVKEIDFLPEEKKEAFIESFFFVLVC